MSRSRPGTPLRCDGWCCPRSVASHHLDVGLDRAGGLDRLQNADQVARADAEPIEAVDELLQRDAVFYQREFLAVLGNPDTGVRRHHGSSARQRTGLADL